MLDRLGVVFVLATASTSATSATSPAMESFGTIQKLNEQHDDAPKVTLSEVLGREHAYALGSLSGLRGEITVVDGTAWLSYPPTSPDKKITVTSSPQSAEKAGFLVASHVPARRWKKVTVAEALSSEGLDDSIERLAATHGLAGTSFPFRVDATLVELTVAVVDGRKVPPGPISPEAMKKANVLEKQNRVEGTLVGFFSPTPDGTFTHPGARSHVHVVVPARRSTGHAQAFKAAAGATVWLPVPGLEAP